MRNLLKCLNNLYILIFFKIHLTFLKKIAYNNIVGKSEFLKTQGVINMLAELSGRSQITIPAEIIKKLEIKIY